MKRTVSYGSCTIDFKLERCDRSTLELTVHPDGTVVAVAPAEATDAEVDDRVLKRARWVLKQQQFFAQFLPRTPERAWAPGETHLYLGRQYRLRVGRPDSERKVRLIRGFLLVDGVEFADRESIQLLVTGWYRDHAGAQFHRRLKVCQERFHDPAAFTPKSVQLRRMNSRWASMSSAGRLSLNPDLVRAPIESIDYVITHELCHIAVPSHGREFSDLLAGVMPDWERRKMRMERLLA